MWLASVSIILKFTNGNKSSKHLIIHSSLSLWISATRSTSQIYFSHHKEPHTLEQHADVYKCYFSLSQTNPKCDGSFLLHPPIISVRIFLVLLWNPANRQTNEHHQQQNLLEGLKEFTNFFLLQGKKSCFLLALCHLISLTEVAMVTMVDPRSDRQWVCRKLCWSRRRSVCSHRHSDLLNPLPRREERTHSSGGFMHTLDYIG